MADMGDDLMMDVQMNDDNNYGMQQNNNDNMQQIQEAVPRLNGQMLHSGNFEGAEISIVGECLGQNGGDNTLYEFRASDDTKFMVKLNMNQPWDGYKTKYIEIRGYVNTDGSITQNSYQEYGNDFAMSTW
eukprot:CAMPEP_0201580470 /NCGR_PEP_ID=MMETSP0190_2-20130828/46910_1 /ASSEMBLY_ACC=CAM_ASM_000263 /TAXON_ID=37353 /ORGANISM="Rosalina sp." /LENGTH=129 /DNA_ID=CAMNT_0048016563 /DNA_START=104 /DNA_END=490 /DNA_ORIENTATION=+